MDSFHLARRFGALSLLLPVPPLMAQVSPNEEIVVVGVPRQTTADALAQPVSVLGGAALERALAPSLGETLAAELGVSASYFGAAASRPVIRGLAGTRVRTMEDGIDSMDVATISVDHSVSIDPLAAEQIEIFRGPTTLLYGSGAVGGVVNTITRRIPDSAPDDGLDGAIEMRTDSALGERGGALRFDGGGERFAWHVDGASRSTDDYRIPGPISVGSDERPGVLPNSSLDMNSGAVGASWQGDDSFVGAAISTYASDYGSPVDEAVRIDLEQTRLDLRGGWTGVSDAIEAISLRFGANDYEHVELEDGETGTRFANRGEELRLEVLASPWREWAGSFGLQLQQRRFEAVGEEAFVPPVDTTGIGAFTVQQRDFGRVELLLGGRLEAERREPGDGTQPDVRGSAGSLSGAVTVELADQLRFVSGIAIAERLPVAEELYSFGPHLASGSFEIGDPTLGAETSRHIDVGIRRGEGPGTWGVTAFRTRFDDFIFQAATGADDPDSGLPILVYAAQDADFHGLEAEYMRVLGEAGNGEIDARVFGDYTIGRLADGSDVPRMPPLRIGARIQFHNERLLAGVEAIRYDDQDRPGALETPTAGYTMLNADVGWSIDPMHRFHLFAKASNLLDEDARRSTSLVKDVVPLPGRSLALGLRLEF